MTSLSEDKIKERIVKRIAQEFIGSQKPVYINLGVGMPTMVANYLQEEENVYLQAENGMLGVGPVAPPEKADRQRINAGRQPVMETPGCCFFDSATSFGMIRGGHIDATVIGAFEVDEKGNVANWIIPNGKMMGVGGAMDLVTGAKRVIIAMQHLDKKGKSKLTKACSLPITGFGEADLVVTELGVFRFEKGRYVLTEIAPEVTLEELQRITEAKFDVAVHLKEMTT
jgi:3-oxoacid CoA-transferase B subunit